jgi:hypothetical protein
MYSVSAEYLSRLAANVKWFNQFFADIRQLYYIVFDEIRLTGFLPETLRKPAAGNFYFTKQNQTPSIPPYYVLGLEGKRFALQVLTVFEPDVFAKTGHFAAEPSVVVVLHSQANRYLHIDNYALRVIENRGIEVAQQNDGKLLGTININPPVDYFSFQVPLEKFSADRNPREAVREYIVDPITEYLGKK